MQLPDRAMDLPEGLEQFVQIQLASGKYQSVSEVITEGLRLLQEREGRLEALRKDAQVGLEQLQRGEFTEYDDNTLRDFFQEIKLQGRERLGAKTDRQ